MKTGRSFFALFAALVCGMLLTGTTPANAQGPDPATQFYRVTALATPPSDSNFIPVAANRNGDVVGNTSTYSSGVFIQRAALTSHTGTFTYLSLPSGFTRSTVSGINDNGVSVGLVLGTSGNSTFAQAALWGPSGNSFFSPPTGYTNLNLQAINTSGAVAGYAGLLFYNYYSLNRAIGFGSGAISLLDPVSASITESKGFALNDSGQIVGEAYDDGLDNFGHGLSGAYYHRAFLWQNGQEQNLGTLPGYANSIATGINAGGQIVGTAFNGNVDGTTSYIPNDEDPIFNLRPSSARAFLWQNGTMTSIDPPSGPYYNYDSTKALGLDAQGQVLLQAKGTGQTDWYFGYGGIFLFSGGALTDLYAPFTFGTIYNGVAFSSKPVIAADGRIYGVGSQGFGYNLSGLLQLTPAYPIPPTVSGISPTAAPVGSSTVTLTITGNYFYPHSVVYWDGTNGTALPTTYVSHTQLTAQIPASYLATAGNYPLVVVTPPVVHNPDDGGVSDTGSYGGYKFLFHVQNPTVVVTSITPSSVPAGSPATDVIVNGSGFVPGDEFQFSLQNPDIGPQYFLGGTYVSPTQFKLHLNASFLSTPGTAKLYVVTSPYAVGVQNGSGEITFNVTGDPLQFSNISVSGVTDTTATLSWTTNYPTDSSADSYIEYGTNASSLSQYAPCTTGGTSHSVTLTGLTPATLYYYVIASYGAFTSAQSDTATFVTAPAGTPRVAVTGKTLTRDRATGSIVATLSLSNTGTADAAGVQITSAKLGGVMATSALPLTVGAIAKGATTTATVFFPPQASGATTVLAVSGTYTGGSFTASFRATVP